MMKRKQQAQVMIEYLLFMAIVLAVLFIFFRRNGFFEKGMRNVVKTTGNHVVETGANIFF